MSDADGAPAGLDWQSWHRDYDDPDSPVSHRMVEVRARLASLLAAAAGPVRLLSLCCGDARDTVPVVAASATPVDVTLVELDPGRGGRALDLWNRLHRPGGLPPAGVVPDPHVRALAVRRPGRARHQRPEPLLGARDRRGRPGGARLGRAVGQPSLRPGLRF
ncbi:MAG: hypothetical protein WAV00_15565 [Nocardioides sp.]